VSSVFPEPSWQLSSSMANSAITSNSSLTGVSSGRGAPDIAADATNMLIYITTSSGSGFQTVSGTSVASPLMAGMIATIDNYMGSEEGFINSLIYKLGQAQVNGSYTSAPPFYFIYNGSNSKFSSANGYSLVVGWGTINAYNFVNSQLGVITYTITFRETGLAFSTLWSVTLNGNTESSTSSLITFTIPKGTYSFTIGSVTGYTVSPSSGSLTVNGSNVNEAITFTPVSVKTYSVTFTETGLPSGILWSVKLNGLTETSTNGTIKFNETNGTYSYVI